MLLPALAFLPPVCLYAAAQHLSVKSRGAPGDALVLLHHTPVAVG